MQSSEIRLAQLKAFALIWGLSISISGNAATLSVGPGKTYATPCQAFPKAVAGDTIEIDAAGSYNGDVCSIFGNNLIIRGVNGRPRIDAAGRNAEGKATWVIKGSNTVVENIEMLGAKVADRNGAAIRQEGAGLTLRRVYFHDNENGILTGENLASDILIENSEFANNGFGDGQTHNMYIGHVRSFTLRGSYSHDARIGHLVKSRAEKNLILYNRLDNKNNGTASYEVNLPNGGLSYVIGNIIHQSPYNDNSILLAYGEEGLSNASSELYVINNTFVNDYASGTFISVRNTTRQAVVRNNAFVGPGAISSQTSAVESNNIRARTVDFVDFATLDMRLAPGSLLIGAGSLPGTSSAGDSLSPALQYVHPASTVIRSLVNEIDVGAYEDGAISGPTSSPSPSSSPETYPSTSPTSLPTSPPPGSSADTVAPTVAISAPLNGAIVRRGSTVTVTASANDNVGVSRVEFYVNGVLKFTDSTPAYSYGLSLTAKRGVQYNLQAKAYDAAGNVGGSAVVTITTSR